MLEVFPRRPSGIQATGSHEGNDWAGRRPCRILGAMPTTAVPTVDDAHFASEVLEADKPVLVDFTAAWCPPCRVMAPVLAELAQERQDLRVVQVDVDREQATAARYEVLSMPTFILFRGGVPVLRLVGARPGRRLRQELDEVL